MAKTVLLKNLLPNFVKQLIRQLMKRTNGERLGVDQFLRSVARDVRPTDRILDAGAGSCEYKPYFSHARYESTDITIKYNRKGEGHTFLSELHHLPIKDNSYDIVVNTQVLEHVEFPQQVINELYRILKPNGKLLLSTPQSWGIHMAPYHFYNFTRYGLESLFRNANFEIEVIIPNGGVFRNLAKIIAKLPRNIMNGYTDKNRRLGFLGLYPFYLLLKPWCEFVIPVIFYYLDSLDKKQDWTIGYLCRCRKTAVTPSGDQVSQGVKQSV